MDGRRRDDITTGLLPDDLQPGDYWRLTDDDGVPLTPEQYDGRSRPSNLTGGVWQFFSPDGNGIGTLVAHTVRLEEDGTISVRPGDGSSNSILHTGGADRSWHGYVEHGAWNEA